MCYAWYGNIKRGVSVMFVDDWGSQHRDKFLIGDIYLMKFEGFGSEQSGWRPGLVFQNNTGNVYSPNIIALPLTSSIKKSLQPTHVVVKAADTGLYKDSMVLCENPERMSKLKIGKYITHLSGDYMKKIASASLIATSAISFLDAKELLDIHSRALEINHAI
jgi:mRNA interferase MazF